MLIALACLLVAPAVAERRVRPAAAEETGGGEARTRRSTSSSSGSPSTPSPRAQGSRQERRRLEPRPVLGHPRHDGRTSPARSCSRSCSDSSIRSITPNGRVERTASRPGSSGRTPRTSRRFRGSLVLAGAVRARDRDGRLGHRQLAHGRLRRPHPRHGRLHRRQRRRRQATRTATARWSPASRPGLRGSIPASSPTRRHRTRCASFDADGSAYTSDVIAAADWIYAHAISYNIRVANFSLAGSSFRRASRYRPARRGRSSALWLTGIVVVASAGNDGPQRPRCLCTWQRPVRDHRRRLRHQRHRDASRRLAAPVVVVRLHGGRLREAGAVGARPLHDRVRSR